MKKRFSPSNVFMIRYPICTKLTTLIIHKLKPIFHWKLSSHWLTNANEMDTNNMKSTWPTPAPRDGDPVRPIFHLLALGVGVGGNTSFSVPVGGHTNFSVFRYQHVGIPNTKLCRWGSKSMRGPNANGFASQWNISYNLQRMKGFYAFTFKSRLSQMLSADNKSFHTDKYKVPSWLCLTYGKFYPWPSALFWLQVPLAVQFTFIKLLRRIELINDTKA